MAEAAPGSTWRLQIDTWHARRAGEIRADNGYLICRDTVAWGQELLGDSAPCTVMLSVFNPQYAPAKGKGAPPGSTAACQALHAP